MKGMGGGMKAGKQGMAMDDSADAILLMGAPMEEEHHGEGEDKEAQSSFDMAADRLFAASKEGNQPAFRSALRSAIKLLMGEMA